MDFDELDELYEAAPKSLELYLKACEAGGGCKDYPEEYTSLMMQTSDAVKADPEAPGPVKKVLELMSLAAVHHTGARSLMEAGDDPAFSAFLAYVFRSAIAPGTEEGLEAMAFKEKKCTGQLFPNRALHQLVFGSFGNAPMCAFCYVHKRAAEEPQRGDGIWAVASCCCNAVPESEMAPETAKLMALVEGVLEGGASEVPASSPLPWKRLLEHLAQVKRMARVPALKAEQWESIRELYHPSPMIKTKTYQQSAGGPKKPSRLVLIMHGAMNTMKQNDFMHFCVFKSGSALPECATVIGIEFDYRHHGWGDIDGYSCERPEQIIARQGETLIQAVRVYRQCIEDHIANNPECKTVDIIAFSSGAYLAYLLMCMAPPNAQEFRIGTLVLLSARLEEPVMVADEVFLKQLLEGHRTMVFIGWGADENAKELGLPFTDISETFSRWVLPKRFKAKGYAGHGHTMTPQELADVQGFLRSAWEAEGM